MSARGLQSGGVGLGSSVLFLSTPVIYMYPPSQFALGPPLVGTDQEQGAGCGAPFSGPDKLAGFR